MLGTDYDFDSSEFNLDDFDEMDFTEDQVLYSAANNTASDINVSSVSSIQTVSTTLTKRKQDKTTVQLSSKRRNLRNTKSTISISKLQLPYETREENEIYFHQRFYSLLAPRPEKPLSHSIDNFPVALVSCLNSSDSSGLSHLLHSSFNENCAIGIHCFGATRVSLEAFLKFIELLDVVHPDRIYSINDTSVVNNRITALSTLTFTDCKLLYEYASKTTTDPDLTSLFHSRADHLSRRFYNGEHTETTRSQLALLVESDADLVVSGTLRFQIAFDEDTNKATGFYVAGGLTSAHLMPTTAL